MEEKILSSGQELFPGLGAGAVWGRSRQLHCGSVGLHCHVMNSHCSGRELASAVLLDPSF